MLSEVPATITRCRVDLVTVLNITPRLVSTHCAALTAAAIYPVHICGDSSLFLMSWWLGCDVHHICPSKLIYDS